MSREVSFRVHCVQYVAVTFGCLNYLWCSSTKSSVSNFFESAYAVVIRIFSLVVCEVLKFSRFMIDWGASENNTGEDIRYRGKKMCSQHKNRKIPSSSSSVFIILRNTQISIWLISRLLSVSFFFSLAKEQRRIWANLAVYLPNCVRMRSSSSVTWPLLLLQCMCHSTESLYHAISVRAIMGRQKRRKNRSANIWVESPAVVELWAALHPWHFFCE